MGLVKPPLLVGKKSFSLLTALLAASLVAGLIFAGFVFVRVSAPISTIQPAHSASQRDYSKMQMQSVYANDMDSVIREYDPAVKAPPYPYHPDVQGYHAGPKR